MIQGDRLREARQQRGLSQAALGHRLGLDGQYIDKLEHGVLRSMTTTTLERLVHALHVSADYLLGLSDCVGEARPDTNGAPTRRRPRRVTRAPGLTDTPTPEQPDTAPTAVASLPEPQQQHAMPGRPQMCPHCAIPLQPLEGQPGLVCPACRYRREEGEIADRVAYAVLPYRQGEIWYAEVPDLDSTGAWAATEAQALALVQAFIATVRASYRQQGVAPPAPETRCVMLDVDA